LSLDSMQLTFYGSVKWWFMVELLKNRIDIIVEVELVEHKDGLRGVSSRTTAKLGTHTWS
jgi:hypothetical protein